jgi:thiol-disulfide isomerase/thioredoxin
MNSASADVSPKKTYRLMAFFAVAVMCLLGVAIFSLSRLQSAPWTSLLTTPDIHSSFRKNLPQFEHNDGAKSLTPQQFEGKWTLLSFWSYSCPPCIEEMPALNSMVLNWQGPDIQVLTVNTDEAGSDNLEFAKAFLSDSEITLPTYYDPAKKLAVAFGVEVYPKHFLVNQEKQIVWEAAGAFRWNEASTRDQLLKLVEQQVPESDQDPVE